MNEKERIANEIAFLRKHQWSGLLEMNPQQRNLNKNVFKALLKKNQGKKLNKNEKMFVEALKLSKKLRKVV